MPQNHTQPPRVAPRIKAAPKIGQIYFCDLPGDAQLPEFWKVRPVVVISFREHSLHGHSTVVPCSTEAANEKNRWAVPLRLNGEQSYVICNHILSVANSRLSTFYGKMIEVDFDTLQMIIGENPPLASGASITQRGGKT